VTTPNSSIRVLLVDDDDTFRSVMSGELSRRGYAVAAAATGRDALSEAARADADVILLDLRLPDMNGIDVLKALREREVPGGVIVLTGHGTIDTAIQAIRLGAYDYLEKPCPIEKVEMVLRRTHEHQRLVARERVLEDGYATPGIEPGFIGATPAFERLRQMLARVAQSGATTLILGETGVGKDLAARLLHAQSPRRDKPFVVVDCAALHESLLQSELFGHEKGAFTGAERQRHGLFEVADGGTLFLDEVGDMSPENQARVLRVLETGRFRRLGGTKEIAVDVRLISATNRDLKEAVSRKIFREDLFFRLSTVTLEIPPLRQRPEDVRLLVEYFTRRFNDRHRISKRFSDEALEVLARYRWPGNVRELIHVVEQVLVLAEDDVIGPADLPPAVRAERVASEANAPDAAGGDMVPLREVMRRHVLAVVRKVGSNRARAARILGISERNLYRLLSKYGRSSDSPRSDKDGHPTP
jgi:DNA-binding NtrC family response regulator